MQMKNASTFFIMKILINLLIFILPILLFIAIIGMPAWYYQLVRWIIFITLPYVSYHILNLKNVGLGILLLTLAFLFNPIFQFYFNRDWWIILDTVALISAIASGVIIREHLHRSIR